MKNSTAWCNLYSNESKFNLTLLPSKIAQQVRYYLFGLVFSGNVFLLYVLFPELALINNLLGSVAISLLIVLTTPLTTKPLPKHMHMTSDGLLSVAPGQYLQLTQACMILPFGCVLSLRASDIVGQPQQPLKRPGARHLFIFRDNLDDRDYRRLCRIILSLKQVLCD